MGHMLDCLSLVLWCRSVHWDLNGLWIACGKTNPIEPKTNPIKLTKTAFLTEKPRFASFVLFKTNPLGCVHQKEGGGEGPRMRISALVHRVLPKWHSCRILSDSTGGGAMAFRSADL